MIKGLVKWFDSKLGYGFITSDDFDKDIFVHYTVINKDGYRTLKEGDSVLFDYNEETGKAENVTVVDASELSSVGTEEYSEDDIDEDEDAEDEEDLDETEESDDYEEGE